MRPARTSATLASLSMIFGVLAACGGPPVTVGTPTSATADQPAADATPAGAVGPTRQTCELFRQMIEGVDTLSTHEQQQLIDKMADAVQYTGNPELMRGVVGMGQGWLNKDPQQFALGMRKLSAECHVPYK
jgi:hypothetical protein